MMRDLSTAPTFPYRDGGVCYVYVGNDGTVTASHTVGGTRDAIENVTTGRGRLFGAWPGEWRTDLFPLTDVAALRAAFKMGAPTG